MPQKLLCEQRGQKIPHKREVGIGLLPFGLDFEPPGVPAALHAR